MNRILLQLGRSNAILSFIILVGVIVGYLNYSQLDEQVIITVEPVSQGTIDKFADFEIDFSFLDDDTYKSLKTFGENPVDPGITGERVDPFTPI